ncbi:MAG: class I SAM-dependent methyltransferase [Chloroflexota bacterium]
MTQQTTDINTTCLVCEGRRARHTLTLNGHHVYTCRNCGFAFVSPTPTPEDLAHFYDQAYAVPFERYAGNTIRNESRIEELERWVSQRGHLLEIGASYGHSLAVAQKRGWHVSGVELSPTAAQYARDHFGLNVATADLLDATFSERFDAVIMWHVLEHTHNPVAQLERIHTLLQPGGVLGLRVPNITSFGARIAGRAWPWLCPPAHLWYFSPHTLPRLLARLGFEVIHVATLRGDGNNPYQHLLSATGSRLNTLRRRVSQRKAQVPGRSNGSTSPATTPPPNPAQLQHAWVSLLQRAQPTTDWMANLTRKPIAALDQAGWGDELLCYAKRAS